MFGIAMAAVLAVSAGVFEADGTTPAGTFACSLLTSDTFDGKEDGLMPSGLGDVTLDGSGGYTQALGGGQVAWKDNALHFTTGEMSGTVAKVRQGPSGHRYLHIDSTVMNAPAGEPKLGDNVCLEK